MDNKLAARLAGFLQLEREFRSAQSLQALAFIATNLSSRLLTYNSALLLTNGHAGDKNAAARVVVHSVSGTSSFDADALALRYLSAAINEDTTLQTVDLAIELALESESGVSCFLLCCPLRCQGVYLGMLALRREHAWLEHEVALASQVSQPLAHAMLVLHQQQRCQRPTLFHWLHQSLQRIRVRWAIPALLMRALLPVRQCVIADR